jgi:hypothetical protein
LNVNSLLCFSESFIEEGSIIDIESFCKLTNISSDSSDYKELLKLLSVHYSGDVINLKEMKSLIDYDKLQRYNGKEEKKENKSNLDKFII